MLVGHGSGLPVPRGALGVGLSAAAFAGMVKGALDAADALNKLQQRTGLDVPLHVDGASGGMVAPFLNPELVWDFRLERVHSINTSGHKYGLVYPGLGRVVWRDKEACPDDLIFYVSYLGGSEATLALNFSRPGSQVLLQYYLFLRLGYEGYTRVQSNSRSVAMYLAEEIGKMEPFELWNVGSDIPVFAWYLKETASKNWSLYDLADRLRLKGWLIPA